MPAWILSGAVCFSAAVGGLDEPASIPDEPFDLRASRLEYTNNVVFASGGVTGTFENVVIRAEEVTANPETGDLHIVGNIQFERGNILWQGDKLDYNYISQAGVFGPSSLYFDPVFMRVDHVERVSTNEYLMRGASVTTCPKPRPHIHATAKAARLVDEKYLTAKGMAFYVGKVPVLYVPYWRHEIKESVFSYDLGYGSDWGAYVQARATIPVTSRIDSVTDLDYYSKRGVGIGQGFQWDYPTAEGDVKGYYLNDQSPYERYDSPTDLEQIDHDRFRFKVEHDQSFSEASYVKTEWNYLSDPAILEEFFKPEYRSNAQPENFGSWVYGNGRVGTEAFASYRLNDFYDNVDRMEYSADLYQTRLGGFPLYLQSENSVARLTRGYAETNTLPDYSSVRLDSANTLYLPQRYGFLNLVPRVGYRATYYSESAVAGRDDEFRAIPGAGVEVSFQATKVLSGKPRWYGDGLRHKIEPYADYIYEDSTLDAARLRQFDHVDMLDDENKVKIGLRNVLQTRREGRTSRFIDLDLYTHYLVERNGAPEDFGNLYFDARMPLTKRTMVDVFGMYDWYAGNIPAVNTRVSYDADDVVFSLEHYYLIRNISLWTPRLELYPDSKVSFETYGRYDDNSNDIEEIAVIGYMNWCCMRYGMGYYFYDDREHRIMLSIGLSAFPKASLASKL